MANAEFANDCPRCRRLQVTFDVNATTAIEAPPDLPAAVRNAFVEGATCVAIGCNNAAGTMFRLAIDLATEPMLPPVGDAGAPNSATRRNLGLRLPWMFEQRLLAADLEELAGCVKEDGNDGAHKGTLTKAEAEDLQDFSYSLLDRIYSEPGRIAAAKDRREKRRSPGP